MKTQGVQVHGLYGWVTIISLMTGQYYMLSDHNSMWEFDRDFVRR